MVSIVNRPIKFACRTLCVNVSRKAKQDSNEKFSIQTSTEYLTLMLLTLILHNNTGAVDAINNENLACTYNNISSFSTTEFDELLLYKHWINGWLTVLVIVGGIFANCVTMFALVHGHMLRTPTNIYLMALSFSNLISLICLLVMSGLRFILVHPYR